MGPYELPRQQNRPKSQKRFRGEASARAPKKKGWYSITHPVPGARPCDWTGSA